MWNDFWFGFVMWVMGFIALCMIVIATVSIVLNASKSNDNQVIAVAEDLGCTYIEQSYHNPNNFYIDCGDGEIRIIKMEK